MSNTIKSLFMPFSSINLEPSTIADSFYYNDIAMVKRITRIPYLYGELKFYCVYIDIEEWNDSEASYNFIKNLKSEQGKTTFNIIGKYQREVVEVQINTHYNPNDDVYLYTFSTNFGKDYYYNQFENVEEEEEYKHRIEFDDIIRDINNQESESDIDLESDNAVFSEEDYYEEEFRELEESIMMHLQECPGY